jgi:predicted enzyme related to lactoylglutathione lyase
MTASVRSRNSLSYRGLEEALMIKNVKLVSIPTSDQDRALAFWTEKLGFKVTTDQPMGPQRWIELSLSGAQTRIVLFTPDGQQDRIGTFFNGSFQCDDVEHTYRQLTERGVDIDPPEKQPWGTFSRFRDPDGNTFLLSAR